MSLSSTALDIARTFIGTKETAPNSGPDVDLFLGSVGLQPGQPWCAAFAHYCFMVAAAREGLENPFPHTGSSLALWRKASAFYGDSNPTVGAVYVLQHSPATGHVGIIEAVNEDGTISEISGNTNAAGSREGDCVARHTGTTPETIHGGELLGYLVFDRAAPPNS